MIFLTALFGFCFFCFFLILSLIWNHKRCVVLAAPPRAHAHVDAVSSHGQSSSPLCSHHHITGPLSLLTRSFYGRRQPCSCLLVQFSASNHISIPSVFSFFFFLHSSWLQQCYCNYLGEGQRYARASLTIAISLQEQLRLFLFFFFPPLLSQPVETSFSQAGHLLISSPPWWREERSVDIGFGPNM